MVDQELRTWLGRARSAANHIRFTTGELSYAEGIAESSCRPALLSFLSDMSPKQRSAVLLVWRYGVLVWVGDGLPMLEAPPEKVSAVVDLFSRMGIMGVGPVWATLNEQYLRRVAETAEETSAPAWPEFAKALADLAGGLPRGKVRLQSQHPLDFVLYGWKGYVAMYNGQYGHPCELLVYENERIEGDRRRVGQGGLHFVMAISNGTCWIRGDYGYRGRLLLKATSRSEFMSKLWTVISFHRGDLPVEGL